MSAATRLEWSADWLALANTLTTGRSCEAGAHVLTLHLVVERSYGWGEVAPQDYLGESIAQATDFLATWRDWLPKDLPSPVALNDLLKEMSAPHCVRSGLVTAAYDAHGRRQNRPVTDILGLADGPRPPTTYTITLDGPDTMARLARDAPPEVRRLKLKLGGDGKDLDRVRAVRQATERQLVVDANGSWSLGEGIALIPALAELGVLLVEQPLPPNHPDTRELWRQSPLPIFLDEDCYSVGDVTEAATRADGVNVKLSKCGGLVDALEMIHTARSLRLGVMIGSEVESSLGIAPAAAISSLADYADLDAGILLEHDPWEGLALVDGVMEPSNRPGFGLRRSAT